MLRSLVGSEMCIRDSIEVVSDAAPVLDLTEHKADRVPGDAPLRVQVVQVVHDKLGRRRKIGLIELVGHVPAQRAEFPTLLKRGKNDFSTALVSLERRSALK